jgi:hypothetical protein
MINKGKTWTNEEIEYLCENYPHISNSIICKHLNRSYTSVTGKAYQFKLKKSITFLESESSGRLTGKDIGSRFEKGHVPFNKGKKMPQEIIEKYKHTFFQKGHKPKNTLFDGAETIRTDKVGNKYCWVRISEGVWRQRAHIEWEKVNGPIPEGFVVRHKTLNTLNDAPENLMLITFKENMDLNSIMRYPKELANAIRLLGKLKRTIHEKQD